MNDQRLNFIVRTPRDVILDQPVRSIRLPTETGQVGLRAKAEPQVLAVEAGMVLVRYDETYQFIGTAGGLLRCDGTTASLLTPLAVCGDDQQQVVDALEMALVQPSVEMEARETLGRLQQSILSELRDSRNAPADIADAT